MKYITPYILMFLMLAVFATQDSAAGTAEASTGKPGSHHHKYDLSGLTDDEMKWFMTFLEGTFFADGWQQISDDILVKISPADRKDKQFVLTELGNKIGREWCKDNTTRRIDTAMLKKWGDRLRTAAKNEPHLIADVIEVINGEVDLLLD